MTQEATALNNVADAIREQTSVFKDLISFFLHGPDFHEQQLGSAEDDGIDDSHGDYDTEQQAIDSIKEQWRKDGYPDEIAKYFK